MVNGCINGQQITQEDKKIIEEEIIVLKQDIQYEENCLEEYSNIVYTEDLNVVGVRLKVSTNTSYYSFEINLFTLKKLMWN